MRGNPISSARAEAISILAARRVERVVGKHHHGLVAKGRNDPRVLELVMAVAEIELLHELARSLPGSSFEQRRFGQTHGACEAAEDLLVREALADRLHDLRSVRR